MFPLLKILGMQRILMIALLPIVIIGCSKSEDSATPNQGNQGSNQLSLATVQISDPTSITENSARLEANVTSDGGASVTSRGLCWSTSLNPTIDDQTIGGGGGTGSFDLQITGLNDDTLYYVRAYAVNSEGVSYSSQVSLTTLKLCEGGVFTGDVWLRSQEDVDAFGANNYSRIDGYLYIVGDGVLGAPVSDLTPLSCLTRVGALDITKGAEIFNLDDLSNLSVVDEYINLFSNWYLENIDGLSGIEAVSDWIQINDNDELLNLDGLSNISGNVNQLIVKQHSKLQNLDGLSGITQVNSHLTIKQNFVLENINGLSGLNTVGGDFILEVNLAIQDVAGLENLTSVGGNFEIWNNAALNNLDGLTDLMAVDGNLDITTNIVLNDFCGLRPLLLNNGLGGTYFAAGNDYNPTKQQIIDGDCSE